MFSSMLRRLIQTSKHFLTRIQDDISRNNIYTRILRTTMKYINQLKQSKDPNTQQNRCCLSKITVQHNLLPYYTGC